MSWILALYIMLENSVVHLVSAVYVTTCRVRKISLLRPVSF